MRLAGGARLAFKRDVVDGVHIFRYEFNDALIVCDRKMRDALVEHGLGVMGEDSGMPIQLTLSGASGRHPVGGSNDVALFVDLKRPCFTHQRGPIQVPESLRAGGFALGFLIATGCFRAPLLDV